MSNFIPGTSPRHIGNGIYFQPIRSWHSGTYAGEGLTTVNGDRSGCLQGKLTSAPLTVTHRLYWNEREPDKKVSSFLSYPGAMGCEKEYFWEIYPYENTTDIDVMRFDTETEMEEAIKGML